MIEQVPEPPPDDEWQDVPHDLAAEQAVIGTCLRDPAAYERAELTPEDYYRPAHSTIWRTMGELLAVGKPCDPVSVSDRIGTAAMVKVGGAPYLHTILERAQTRFNIGHFAGIIRGHARRRAVIEEAMRVMDAARGCRVDAEALVDESADLFGRMRYAATGDDLTSLRTLNEFVEQPIPAQSWVIPGLLARGDRVVITGSEGLGKSTVCRQAAAAAAAGLHPFTLAPCDPRLVLVLDLENPLGMMIDAWSGLRTAAANRGRPIADGRLMIDRRPEGLDITDRNDLRWITHRVETIRPDLLVIGPVYKLYVGGGSEKEETLARAVTRALDRLRESVGCALMLEHHSPHTPAGMKSRPVRPIGSSLWLRWPEFGWGIRRINEDEDRRLEDRRLVEVIHWRGQRSERPWPRQMQAGSEGWPWAEVDQPRGTW